MVGCWVDRGRSLWGGAAVPIGSEVGQHLIQGVGVDHGIHPASTVRGHGSELRLQAGDEGIVSVILAGDLVKVLIVAQPQGDIPGCPVCPTVVGFGFGDHGGESVHGWLSELISV